MEAPTGSDPSAEELRAMLVRKDEILRLLKEVALAMNEAQSASSAIEYVLKRICHFTGWPIGHAYLMSDTRPDVLVPTSIFYLEDRGSFEDFRAATAETSFRKGTGLPGRVMAERAPIWISDIRNDPDFPRAKLVDTVHVRSGFAFPVVVGERVRGVLEFFCGDMVEPDHELLDATTHVGAQLGRVIEREQAAETIRGSEERLRALTSSIHEAIITADESGRIIGWAGGAEGVFGYSAEEAQGRDLVMLMPNRHVDRHRKGLARYRTTGEAHIMGRTIEIEAQRKDGSEFPVELSLSEWSARGERYFTAVIRDVTDRRQAEDRLREREHQLERAQQIAQLGSWQFDIKTGRIEWSDELCRIYGVPAGSCPSFESYVDMLHPDEQAPVQEIIGEALKSGESFSFYNRIIRQDTGEERILHCEGEVAKDADGNPRSMFGTALDVTELKRTEENLRERERLFRLLAENMTDIVLLLDPEGRIDYASPSCRRVLGFRVGDLQGKSIFDFVHPADQDVLRTGAYDAMQEGETYLTTVVRVRKEGGEYVVLELASRPIRSSDGTVEHVLSSAREVTERIRAEEEAAKYRSELEKRNRELEDFAYVASHDLQEPLRKIRAFSGLLAEDFGESLEEEALGYLDRVQDAATRMSTLISDLLQFSRITTRGEPFAKLDLNKILDGVLSDLEVAVAESDAKIERDELPEIEADSMQMRQLFQNLLSNALKFSRDGVQPAIRISSSIEPPARNTRAVERCRIVVADNGIGFDAKYADRIFTPFQRLHHRREFEGTGMGLAICRRIVERHNGTIAAESAPEEGATFTIELPVRQRVES